MKEKVFFRYFLSRKYVFCPRPPGIKSADVHGDTLERGRGANRHTE